MKQLLTLMILSLCSPLALIAQTTQGAASPAKAADTAAVALVHSYFKAFDARDYKALENVFVPQATIVHHDGVVTDIPKMLAIIRNAKAWPPRDRKLSNFETTEVGDATLVSCLNEVTFHRPYKSRVKHTYAATWVMVPTASGIKAVRFHYSRVTRQEHSEDMP
jgi:hypothetical protein